MLMQNEAAAVVGAVGSALWSGLSSVVSVGADKVKTMMADSSNSVCPGFCCIDSRLSIYSVPFVEWYGFIFFSLSS